MEVDAGTEFHGVFKRYVEEKNIELIEKIAGRHRQQAVVEGKNCQIGKVLNIRMLAEEMNTGQHATGWVNFLQGCVKDVNKHFSHPAIKPNIDAPVRVPEKGVDMLPLGIK